MQPEQIMSIVGSVSGHIHVTMKTEKKPAAKSKGIKLEKVTSGAYRVGINYANLKGVREGIENGERGEVGSLPKNTEWVVAPYHARHTITGTDYLRLYYPTGGEIQIPKVTYLVEGQEVDKETFNSHLTPSDAKDKERDPNSDCFWVKMENVMSIGND